MPEDKLLFSPHDVDNERFAGNPAATLRDADLWRRSLGIPAEHALIMFAGKFEDKKRPLDLLEAFVQLGTVANVSLVFVGAGHLQSELHQRAAGHPGVFFAPFQNQTQMPRTYAAADIFVLPSGGNSETWGLAINEALCLACPVIVSDHVGCAADLVLPGRNGLVFPAGNIRALTAALREALSDRQRLVRWGEEGRQIVAAYSYAAATHGLFAALDALGTRRSVS